jgi:hypothetical protein
MIRTPQAPVSPASPARWQDLHGPWATALRPSALVLKLPQYRPTGGRSRRPPPVAAGTNRRGGAGRRVPRRSRPRAARRGGRRRQGSCPAHRTGTLCCSRGPSSKGVHAVPAGAHDAAGRRRWRVCKSPGRVDHGPRRRVTRIGPGAGPGDFSVGTASVVVHGCKTRAADGRAVIRSAEGAASGTPAFLTVGPGG